MKGICIYNYTWFLIFVIACVVRAQLCKKGSSECRGSMLRICTDEGYWSEMKCPMNSTCVKNKNEIAACSDAVNEASDDEKIPKPSKMKNGPEKQDDIETRDKKRGKEDLLSKIRKGLKNRMDDVEEDSPSGDETDTPNKKKGHPSRKDDDDTEDEQPSSERGRKRRNKKKTDSNGRSEGMKNRKSSRKKGNVQSVVTVTKVPTKIDISTGQAGADGKEVVYSIVLKNGNGVSPNIAQLDIKPAGESAGTPSQGGGSPTNAMGTPNPSTNQPGSQMPSNQTPIQGQSSGGSSTPSPSGFPTPSPSGFPTPSPSGSPTQPPSGASTPSLGQSPSGSPTQPSGGSPISSPGGASTPSPTPSPGGASTPSPTPSPSGASTPSPTPSPGGSSPTPSPTPSPSGSSPTPSPTPSPGGSSPTPSPDKPSDNKPADNKPADKPSDNKPSDNKPSDNKSADNKSADNKPSDNKPSDTSDNKSGGGEIGGVNVEKVLAAVKEVGISPKMEYAKPLLEKAKEYFKDKNHLAMFLAQLAHESEFAYLEEVACASGKCGSGTYGTGEPGKSYHGRGFIQLSWPDNYKAAGEALGMGDKLYKNPELVSKDLDIATKVSLWYWDNRVKPNLKGKNEFGLTTKAINGALECNGQASEKSKRRYKLYTSIAKALGVKDIASESGCYN